MSSISLVLIYLTSIPLFTIYIISSLFHSSSLFHPPLARLPESFIFIWYYFYPGALERLQLYPEVDVYLLLGDMYVTGRADWLLCHDDPQYGIDSTLLAIEAKRSHEFSSADSQIAMYLAAVQASRVKSKIHAIAFGIATDSNQFRFWFMDSERRLFSSTVFEWRLHKAKIIA